jgi:hypothetical protein
MAGRVFSDDDFVEDEGPSPRFDMRTGQIPSLDPLDAAIKRRAAQQAESPGIVEAGLRGGAQGLTGGFFDEMVGSSGAYGVGGFGLPGMSLGGVRDAAIERERAGDPSGRGGGPSLTGLVTGEQRPGIYDSIRDESRGRDAQAAQEHPLAYYPGMIGGAIMSPIKGPSMGSSIPGRLAGAAVRGFAEGAVFGAGQSESDDAMGVLRDTGASAGLGGAMGLAGQVVSEGVKGAGNLITKNLKKRVVNEFAEGLESKTTPTQQKHLDRAQEDIYREVSTGPDAKAVRGTVYKGAAEGREVLKPIIDEVGTANKENYAQFVKAGRGKVDIADYMQRLAAKADEADQAGDTELFEAINSHIDEVDKAYQRTGDMALTRLRGMTTKVQKHAASAVGGLNTHAAAELEGRLMATATEAMDDTLGIAAAGDPALEAAAQSIRSNNRRIYALKTVDKGLQLREHKEAAGPGFLVQTARAAGTPGAAAGAGYVLSEDEDKIGNALMAGGIGLGAKGLVPLAKLAQRGITSAGIKTQLPGYGGPSASTVGRAVRPFVPPLSLSLLDAYQRRREQEK